MRGFLEECNKNLPDKEAGYEEREKQQIPVESVEEVRGHVGHWSGFWQYVYDGFCLS